MTYFDIRTDEGTRTRPMIPWPMPNQLDADEYAICQERGHGAGSSYTTAETWIVCSFCGMHYRIETVERVVERFEVGNDE